jgi:hypothetical protein
MSPCSGSVRSCSVEVTSADFMQSASSDHTNGWTAHANAAIAAGSKYLLGCVCVVLRPRHCIYTPLSRFNEPDLNTQSNMTPAAAAAAWMQYMQPFAGKAKLISPAITNGAAPMGTAWLDA